MIKKRDRCSSLAVTTSSSKLFPAGACTSGPSCSCQCAASLPSVLVEPLSEPLELASFFLVEKP
eukprot:5429358-Karenia_brevis.AAC.1